MVKNANPFILTDNFFCFNKIQQQVHTRDLDLVNPPPTDPHLYTIFTVTAVLQHFIITINTLINRPGFSAIGQFQKVK